MMFHLSKDKRQFLRTARLLSIWALVWSCSCVDADGDSFDLTDGLIETPVTETPVMETPVDPQQFLDSCAPAPEPALPTEPMTCAGPDADGWNNDVRPEGAGPCPPPPQGGCTQIVIGRLSDTARYIDCPGFIVLNRSDWTIELNDNFIACVADCDLGTCDPQVLLVSGPDEIPNFDGGLGTPSVTSRELCQLENAGCAVVLPDEGGLGFIDCLCPPDDDPEPPSGGCCFDDTTTCSGPTTEADCIADGGEPQSSCGSDPCAFACCLADGTCSEDRTVNGCTAAGGAVNARGSKCGSVTCAQPAPAQWVLVETQVNPDGADDDFVGTGRAEGTVRTFTTSANNISVADRSVDNGYEFWNVNVASSFPTPPMELTPSDVVVLTVSFSSSGTVTEGNPGAQFQYWVNDGPIDPLFSYFYLPWSPTFSGESSTEYSFTVPPVGAGGELTIAAFWWNCGECDVIWVYQPG